MGSDFSPRESISIRLFDVVAAAIAITVLLPVFAAIAISVKTTSPGSVFFRQLRLGKRGRPFRIYKFRTMLDGTEHTVTGALTAPEDGRITRVGRFLRRWSIDELPQLLNVVRGEMSVVGPRPALTSYLEKYDARQARRLHVPPGITGWAQVNGRNALTWPERIDRDVWYVDHRSLSLNLRILARTIPVLFQRRGLYGPARNFEMGADSTRSAAG